MGTAIAAGGRDRGFDSRRTGHVRKEFLLADAAAGVGIEGVEQLLGTLFADSRGQLGLEFFEGKRAIAIGVGIGETLEALGLNPGLECGGIGGGFLRGYGAITIGVGGIRRTGGLVVFKESLPLFGREAAVAIDVIRLERVGKGRRLGRLRRFRAVGISARSSSTVRVSSSRR